MSDFGDMRTGDGNLKCVAVVSEFATAVSKYSKLGLKDEATGLGNRAAKLHQILVTQLSSHTKIHNMYR